MAEEIRLLAAGMVGGSRATEEETADEEADDAAPTKVKAVPDRALRSELPWCLDVMATWYRDCLAAAEDSALINVDCAPAIKRATTTFSCRYAEAGVEAILETKQQIERNANIDLALECLASQLASGMNDGRPRGVS
jgi:hypothetical protein